MPENCPGGCATTRQSFLPLTSSAEDGHASLIPSPGSDRAQRMTVTSGQRCLKLSRLSGPLGSLERMFLESSRLSSTTCFLTWKDSATPAGRLLFRLVPSMPRTAVIESGLWPTPTRDSVISRDRPYAQGGMPLSLAARLVPTPGANDWRSGKGFSPEGRGHSPQLRHLADGMLNPEWIEWLMGFPIGWTE